MTFEQMKRRHPRAPTPYWHQNLFRLHVTDLKLNNDKKVREWLDKVSAVLSAYMEEKWVDAVVYGYPLTIDQEEILARMQLDERTKHNHKDQN